jgi:hypothetical protein
MLRLARAGPAILVEIQAQLPRPIAMAANDRVFGS